MPTNIQTSIYRMQRNVLVKFQSSNKLQHQMIFDYTSTIYLKVSEKIYLLLNVCEH